MSSMEPGTLLVVDDEEPIRELLREVLTAEGHTVHLARNGREALEFLTAETEAVIMDVRMPDMNGLKVLEAMKGRWDNLPVIIVTAYGTSDVAISAMKLGAFDYLIKPFRIEEMAELVEKALRVRRLTEESHLETISGPKAAMTGQSPAMQDLYKAIGRVAPSNATVLILGESGTGKELVARAIHQNSPRFGGPFIDVSCAALPESLLESELFGHEKGAFTGASERRRGRFELADGGTLFLDEIGEISPLTQTKLLRVLQEREFQRVGGHETVRVDVRLLAATNRDLWAMVQEGKFREDLYYRLNVVALRTPPLRERAGDIRLLAHHFLAREGALITSDALRILEAHPWPGNVRQLENICQRAAVLAGGGPILPEHLTELGQGDAPRVRIGDYNQMVLRVASERGDRNFYQVVADVEKALIVDALAQHEGNRTRAAQALGINRRLLYSKMQEYGLEASHAGQPRP